jgi:hypothetical protein
MRLAGWVGAVFVGFALAASFMDAPARWLAPLLKSPTVEGAAPVTSAVEAPGQVGRLLAARTRALEEFADRCAPEQWDQAEELRDAAGRAELQGERFEAEDFDEQATALYEEARSEALLRREEGRCLDQSTYEEMPQPNPRDPARDPEKVDEAGELPPAEAPYEVEPGPDPSRDDEIDARRREAFPAPEREAPADPALDDAEAGLRSRAATLAARGDPCAAAKLLREQGSSQRTLLLARELLDRCRRRRDR